MLDFFLIQSNDRGKTANRHAAENSLRSMFSYAIAVASAHFIVDKSLSANVLSVLPKEDAETVDLVSKLSNGAPCMPINPKLMFSPDDTTLRALEGVEEKRVIGGS